MRRIGVCRSAEGVGATGLRPRRQMMAFSMSRIENRINTAKDKLASIDFILPADFEFDLEAALARTGKNLWIDATLWIAMGIKHLIETEQPISVRGVYYRAFSSKLYSQGDIKKVESRVLKLRRAGLVPFHWITDSTRRLIEPATWLDKQDFAEWVSGLYRKQPWQTQPHHVEVFSEKETMTGVIEPITAKYAVPLIPFRGYLSETWVYDIAERWRAIDKPIHAYYLGDHDPKGLDIPRDFSRRIKKFLEGKVYDLWRIGVTHVDFADPQYQQFHFHVAHYKKTAKVKGDYLAYQQQFGEQALELDAIPTGEIRRRVEQAILSHIDNAKWQALIAIEAIATISLQRGPRSGGINPPGRGTPTPSHQNLMFRPGLQHLRIETGGAVNHIHPAIMLRLTPASHHTMVIGVLRVNKMFPRANIVQVLVITSSQHRVIHDPCASVRRRNHK
jgi:hypothetical protein